MASKLLRPGINDLATTMPEVAAQWDDEKNEGLQPCDVMAGSGKRVWWKCLRGHTWKTAVYHRKAGHGCPRCTAQKALLKSGVNDLATKAPELAGQWDCVKNAPLVPQEITCYSQQKVWWRCDLGHSWCATVSHRYQGEGCPVCSGQKLLPGFNDLAATNPDLAREWNYERNGALYPEHLMAGSGTKVWWKCSCGFEWQAPPYSRKAGAGCPRCAGNTLIPGFNDIRTARQDLVSEWDYEKNHPLTPQEAAAFSRQKAWWKCALGHSWNACIYSRAAGKGCPYCGGRKVLSGFNDLASGFPKLIQEWDDAGNAPLSPTQIMSSSHRKVWWHCTEGHHWKASPANRIRGSGCPVCAGKQVLIGYNDLSSQNPALSAQWAKDLNGTLTPQMVTLGSNRSVWWRCEMGHTWRATVSARRNTNCPFCTNRAVLVGFNDFATVHPELLEEWVDEKNSVKPSEVVFGARRKVWWRCRLGHTWRAEILSRHKGTGCPVCAAMADKHIVVPGQNDLYSLAPELVMEWDYERNHPLTPDQLMRHSNRKVWWKCSRNHQWRTSPNHRSRGNGCPYCAGKRPCRNHLIP